MKLDYCPALVAEDDLRKIEHAIFDAVGVPMGINWDSLFHHGVDDYKKFIDLVVKSIVSMPDFVNPMKGL